MNHQQLLDTPVGRARLDYFPAGADSSAQAQAHRATVVLGHGTATGVEAADLQALAAALPARGFTVVLVTQPYRVEGNPRVADPASLDRAWTAVWAHLVATSPPGPIVAGGRSAGSQVACRTAARLDAAAVLVLAYPLRGPGSAAELTAIGLPALVVQGTADPFGTPADMPPLPSDMALVEIPGGDHMFRAAPPADSRRNLETITNAVATWLETVPGIAQHPKTDTRRGVLGP
jgi:predicted alpha/beta-hydrolase family hydrolase